MVKRAAAGHIAKLIEVSKYAYQLAMDLFSFLFLFSVDSQP
jgi:hypothetical protein